ncbi:MAG: Mfa1 fimbrilin C-terminal domain-containing protein [Bacteroidales bacterium]|nr:Mfa1 fimbrilin C-terminal domain-containing protein [Bacteroidales bacterium]
MKKTFISALAAVAVIAAGCQKAQGPETGRIPSNPDGTAFMSVAVNFPSLPATKANDVFDDGSENEYAVEDAYLLVFAGLSERGEAAMTLRSAYDLNAVNFQMEQNQQITSSKVVTAQIVTNNIQDSEDAYAFVILNNHGLFSIEDTDLYKGDTKITEMAFGEFSKIALDLEDNDYSNKTFTMTNMPSINTMGMTVNPLDGEANPSTLVKIEKSNIKGTAEEARLAPAAIIDVERVVAKVTVSTSLTGAENKLAASELFTFGTSDDVTFEILGWVLDNTNKTGFITRNIADPTATDPYSYLGYKAEKSAYYRMASASPVHAEIGTQNPVVRTYWGIDANYNTPAEDMMVLDGKIASEDLLPLKSNAYCAENTFDVEHQTEVNTTRVIVAAAFNGGESFYTFAPASGYIFSQDNLQDQIKTVLLARNEVSSWVKEYAKADADLMSILDVTVEGQEDGTATVALAIASDDVLAEVVKAEKSVEEMKDAFIYIKRDEDAFIAKSITKEIAYYADGIAYYPALIRHFNEDETPWTANTSMQNTTESIYNLNNANDYLGRYSVLRNNWYDINVTAVKALGTPVIPELTDDPDDTVETYLAVKINIMPWARRTYDVQL